MRGSGHVDRELPASLQIFVISKNSGTLTFIRLQRFIIYSLSKAVTFRCFSLNDGGNSTIRER